MKQENLKGKFIYYCGRYWLIEKYDKDLYKGGFFAVPIYCLENNKVEVRHAGSNWCYKSNGAFLKDPEIDVIIESYKSQLEHLKWCKTTQMESTDYYEDEMSKINKQTRFYEKLLKKWQNKKHSQQHT